MERWFRSTGERARALGQRLYHVTCGGCASSGRVTRVESLHAAKCTAEDTCRTKFLLKPIALLEHLGTTTLFMRWTLTGALAAAFAAIPAYAASACSR